MNISGNCGKIVEGLDGLVMSTNFLLTMPSNILPLHLKQTFPPIIWIFIEGEGDGIESRLPFKFFSTLRKILQNWFHPIMRWAQIMCSVMPCSTNINDRSNTKDSKFNFRISTAWPINYVTLFRLVYMYLNVK